MGSPGYLCVEEAEVNELSEGRLPCQRVTQ